MAALDNDADADLNSDGWVALAREISVASPAKGERGRTASQPPER